MYVKMAHGSQPSPKEESDMDNELHALTCGKVQQLVRQCILVDTLSRVSIRGMESCLRVQPAYINPDEKPWHVPYWQRQRRNKR